MKGRAFLSAAIVLSMALLATSQPPAGSHASAVPAIPPLNCGIASAPGFTLNPFPDHSSLSTTGDILTSLLCNYSVQKGENTVAGLAVTIAYDCAKPTLERWNSITNNGQDATESSIGDYVGFAGDFHLEIKRFVLIDANTIATILILTETDTTTNLQNFTADQAQPVAATLAAAYSRYGQNPDCQALDLCTLVPVAPGFALDPGIGQPGSTTSCKSTNNKSDRKWNTLQVTKYVSVAEADTYVEGSRQQDNADFAAQGGATALVPSTAYGDAGHSFDIPAVYDSGGSMLRAAGLIYASRCYVVEGDAGYDPSNSARSNDPAQLQGLAVAMDHQLQSATCGNGGVTGASSNPVISYPVSSVACPDTYKRTVQIVRIPPALFGTPVGVKYTGGSTPGVIIVQLNQPLNVQMVQGLRIQLPSTKGWVVTLTDPAGGITTLSGANANYTLNCGKGGDTLGPGVADTLSGVQSGLIDSGDIGLIKDGIGDVFNPDSGKQPFSAGAAPEGTLYFGKLLSPVAGPAATYTYHYLIDATDPATTKLTVFNGHVKVTPANTSLQPVTVGAAQSVSVSQANISAPASVVSIPGDVSQAFPQTGQTASGIFLDYWNSHGGLAQQGYPISGLLREVSALDNKPYTVQYFERAVFEFHPEFAPPNDVLLSQLGTFRYHQKYPTGAPNQHPDQTNGQLFQETGHWVGGKFLQYWQSHGGLAQQGLPLSDEFTEISDTDGKPYTVQYFERAVFEMHPENAPPNDVLLSLLGVFYNTQQHQPHQTPTPVPPGPGVTPTPSSPGASCSTNIAAASNGGSIAGYSSNYGGRYTPDNLIDGTITYGWSSVQGAKVGQYVIVALPGGQTYTINKVRLDPFTTSTNVDTYKTDSVKDFQIRVSTTDANPGSFNPVFQGQTPMQNLFFDFTFPPVQARYVMLYVSDNWGGDFVEAAEFEVYPACR